MFTIIFDLAKQELRVARLDALSPRDVFDVREDGRIYIPHHCGIGILVALPPECDSVDELPLFDTQDAAWSSIRADYCPSLHP